MEKLTLDQLDPAKLNELTDEQIASLRDLSTEEIIELGNRYPNKPTQNNYLVLENTSKGSKQLNNLSSWKKLADLRGAMDQKFWVVKSLKAKFLSQKPVVQAPAQDLTKTDVENAEGLKTAPVQKLNEGVVKDINTEVTTPAQDLTKTDLDTTPNSDINTDENARGEKIQSENITGENLEDKGSVKVDGAEDFNQLDADLQSEAQKLSQSKTTGRRGNRN